MADFSLNLEKGTRREQTEIHVDGRDVSEVIEELKAIAEGHPEATVWDSSEDGYVYVGFDVKLTEDEIKRETEVRERDRRRREWMRRFPG